VSNRRLTLSRLLKFSQRPRWRPKFKNAWHNLGGQFGWTH